MKIKTPGPAGPPSLLKRARTGDEETRRQMMGKRITIVISIIIAAVIVFGSVGFYVDRQNGINSVITYMTDVMEGKVDLDSLKGTSIEYYAYQFEWMKIPEGASVEVHIQRRKTRFDFLNTYIWVRYSFRVWDKNGQILDQFSNSWTSSAEWKIHKKNGKWEIAWVIDPIW